VEEGIYAVSYVPEDIGTYTISIKLAGQEIPSGPFTVNTVASGNASAVTFTSKYRNVCYKILTE